MKQAFCLVLIFFAKPFASSTSQQTHDALKPKNESSAQNQVIVDSTTEQAKSPTTHQPQPTDLGLGLNSTKKIKSDPLAKPIFQAVSASALFTGLPAFSTTHGREFLRNLSTKLAALFRKLKLEGLNEQMYVTMLEKKNFYRLVESNSKYKALTTASTDVNFEEVAKDISKILEREFSQIVNVYLRYMNGDLDSYQVEWYTQPKFLVALSFCTGLATFSLIKLSAAILRKIGKVLDLSEPYEDKSGDE